MNILNHQGVKYISVAALTGGIIMAPKLLDSLKYIGRYINAPDTAEAAYDKAESVDDRLTEYLEAQTEFYRQQAQQIKQRPEVIRRKDRDGVYWCSYDEIQWWRC